jgi:hypothetical protein
MRCQIGNTRRGKPPKITANTLHLWTFDENGASSDARDVVGVTDLPIVSSSVTRQSGPSGYSALLTGATTSGFHSTNHADENVAGDLTVSVLVREDDTVGGTFVAYGNDTVGTADYRRFTMGYDANGKVTVSWQIFGGTIVTYSTTNSIPRRDWYNVITVKKVDAGGGLVDVFVYVNGRQVEQIANNVTSYASGSNAEWWIGMRPSSIGPNLPFDGYIGFVHVEKAALSDTEIQNISRRLMLLDGDRWVDMQVFVEDGDSPSSMVELSDLEGENFLRSVSWNDDLDAKSVAATVEVAAAIDRYNMYFLNEASKLNLTDTTDPSSFAPLLMAGRDVNMYRAILPLFVDAVSTDWLLFFEGEIDKVKSSNLNSVSLECRDKGCILGYTMIEAPTWYSNLGTPSAPVDDDSEDVMQQILDDWHPDTPTLRVDDAMAFALHGYEQQQMSIHDAFDAIAMQRAADCRLKWHPDGGTGSFEITYYLVGEDRTDADLVLTADDYLRVEALEIERSRVRNRIEGAYYDDTTLDNQGNPKINKQVVQDTASQTKYGKQYMAITESGTSQIDTAAELTNLLNISLDALKEPEAYLSLPCRFLPEVQVHNIAYLPANKEIWTTDQALAVASISHKWSKEEASSTLNMRGKPAYGHRKILARGAGATEWPSVTAPVYPLAGDVTLQSIVGGVRVSFPSNQFKSQQRKRGRHSHTEIHAKLGTADFSPDSTTLVAFGDKIDFEITDLLPGQNYRVKVIGVDHQGRTASPIDLGSIDTKRAGPAYANEGGGDSNLRRLLRGHDFSAVSRGDRNPANFPPDYWNAVTTWGTTMQLLNAGYRGGKRVQFNTGGVVSQLRSDLIPIQQFGTALFKTEYQIDGVYYLFQTNMLGAQLIFEIEYFSDLTTYIATETIATEAPTTIGDYAFSKIIVGNASARYARISIRTATDFAVKYAVDSIDIIELLPSWDVYDNAGQALTTGVWTKVTPLTTKLVIQGGISVNWDVSVSDFTATRDCRISISASCVVRDLPSTGAYYARLDVFLNGAQHRLLSFEPGPGFLEGSTYALYLSGSIDNLSLVNGDVVDIRVYHNAGAGVTISTTFDKTWIAGRVVE